MKKLNSKLSFAALVAVSLSLGSNSGFAQLDHYDDEDLFGDDIVSAIYVQDPIESINRVTFDVNDFIYLNIFEPVADGYAYITPDPVEEGASNFFSNLKYPIRLVGNLLQGRFDGAWVETGRFAINTTVGIAGIFTPADSVEGFEPIPAEDIGQVLGAWGVSDGPYLVLPVFGPSNLRDVLGFAGDRAVNPLQEPFSVIDEWEWRFALSASEFIATSPSIMERYKQLKGSSIDPYGSMKNGYTQYRQAAIKE
ncbi:MAG: MlaA family lipoprotein [Opitutaceae bacterium]